MTNTSRDISDALMQLNENAEEIVRICMSAQTSRAVAQLARQYMPAVNWSQITQGDKHVDNLKEAREVVAQWDKAYGEEIRAGNARKEMVEAVLMGIARGRELPEEDGCEGC